MKYQPCQDREPAALGEQPCGQFHYAIIEKTWQNDFYFILFNENPGENTALKKSGFQTLAQAAQEIIQNFGNEWAWTIWGVWGDLRGLPPVTRTPGETSPFPEYESAWKK